MVSLTFLEAWRKRDTIEPGGGSLQPWLLSIAVNVSRSMPRAGRRYQMAMSRLPPPPLVTDFAEDVAGRLDDTAQLKEVGRALAALRRGEREVIALCVWSEMDYATAARALGVRSDRAIPAVPGSPQTQQACGRGQGTSGRP